MGLPLLEGGVYRPPEVSGAERPKVSEFAGADGIAAVAGLPLEGVVGKVDGLAAEIHQSESAG